MTPVEVAELADSLGDKSIKAPETCEDQALRFLGRYLNENFCHGYTKKPWGVEPDEPPASILRRLPVRFNCDDNCYANRYQGIPLAGYTAIIERILDHPTIEIRVGDRLSPDYKAEFSHLFNSSSARCLLRRPSMAMLCSNPLG